MAKDSLADSVLRNMFWTRSSADYRVFGSPQRTLRPQRNDSREIKVGWESQGAQREIIDNRRPTVRVQITNNRQQTTDTCMWDE